MQANSKKPNLVAAFALSALILVADQVNKWWILGPYDLPAKGSVPIIDGFFNLTMVWNRGVSLGLFPAGSDSARWFLIAVTGAISVMVAYWLVREKERVQALALAIILGGALGNIIDRVRFGAVVDFLHFHWGSWSFYVFNIADAAITIGVGILVLMGLKPRHKNEKEAGQ